MTSESTIIKWAKKIKAGEKVFRPYIWGEKDPHTYCPDDGDILEWLYEGGIDPDSYEVYECPTCKKEWTSSVLLDISSAFEAAEGKDPYEGSIFVEGNANEDQSFYTKKFPFDKLDGE